MNSTGYRVCLIVVKIDYSTITLSNILSAKYSFVVLLFCDKIKKKLYDIILLNKFITEYIRHGLLTWSYELLVCAATRSILLVTMVTDCVLVVKTMVTDCVCDCYHFYVLCLLYILKKIQFYTDF